MKKTIAVFIFTVLHLFSFAQAPRVDKWTFSTEYSSNGEALLVFTLKLDAGWHVYSQNTPAGGPLPMVFKFEPNSCYELLGKCIEPKPHEEYDSTFETKVLTFDKEVTFRQQVKVKTTNCKIKGTIEYQVCKDACIFKETSFDFNLVKITGK
ncbi:MAG: protein-disulfide reductase DsbD family protein [Bacteroidetes bacterium]|nr:protein-disulfide reductase DsbD family protein [Bacteroidota bacterium]